MNTSKYFILTTFINSFILKIHRSRYLLALEDGRKGGNVMASMSNLTCLDAKFCQKIPKGSKIDNAKFIKQLIKDKVKSNTCIIFSEFKLINEKEFSVDEALDTALSSGGPTIISFIPNSIAFYEGESPDERYLCIK